MKTKIKLYFLIPQMEIILYLELIIIKEIQILMILTIRDYFQPSVQIILIIFLEISRTINQEMIKINQFFQILQVYFRLKLITLKVYKILKRIKNKKIKKMKAFLYLVIILVIPRKNLKKIILLLILMIKISQIYFLILQKINPLFFLELRKKKKRVKLKLMN